MRKIIVVVLLLVIVTACQNDGDGASSVEDTSSAEQIDASVQIPNTPEPTPTATSLPPTATFAPYVTPEHIFPATTRTIHTVQPGDTLTKIAAQYGVTVDAISDANRHFDFDLILVGDQLYIPDCEP
ncbi:MAG: LysM peptidoglycan-binding domain-containing protein [Anaerolineales bacterium]|nr:LysM peptidoglycan-binding domain-containing protein [Anaerolineales bacterium]